MNGSNNFILDLIAGLNKKKSKQQIKKDAKELGDIFTLLIGKLNISKTRKQIKQQLSGISSGNINLNASVNKNRVATAVKQATKQAQNTANSKPVALNFTVQKEKLLNDIQILGQANSKLFKSNELTQKYNSLFDSVKFAQNSHDLSEAALRLRAFRSELKATNMDGLTLGDTFKKTIKRTIELFGSYGLIMQFTMQLRNATKQALELDTALTNLARVNSEVSRGNFPEYLDKCIAKCKELRIGVKDYIDTVTTFSRAGYNLVDSETLAEYSTVLSKVGDMSVDKASEGILATVQAFDKIGGYTSDELDRKVSELIDKVDILGNKSSITQEDLLSAVESVGSVMEYSHTSIDETLSLISAGNRSIQDANKVALSLRTSALRIRAASSDKSAIEELEAMGESTDDLAVSVASLRQEIMALTNVDGTGGIDILEENEKTFRSIYAIYNDIAKVRDQMSDLDFSNLLNLIAGKNRANAVSAMIGNMDEANRLLETSLNATGTATEEYNIYLESAEAATERFGVAVTETYNNILNGDTVKGLANLGSATLEFANKWGLVESTLKGVIAIGILKFVGTVTTAVKASVVQVEAFGRALNGANNLSNFTRGTKDYTAALNALKVSCINLTDTQLKQVLSNKNLTNSERVKILQYQGLTQAEAQAKVAQMGFTQSTNAQTAANGTAIASTFSLKNAVVGLGASMKAAFLSNPIGIVIMTISSAIGICTSAISKHNQKLEEAAQATKEAADKASDLTKNLGESIGKYKSLSKEVRTDSSVKKDLIDVQADLLKALNLEGESIGNLIEKYGSLDDAINQVTLDSLQKAEADLISGLSVAETDLRKVGRSYEKKTSVTDRNMIFGNSDSVNQLEALKDAGIIDGNAYGSGGGYLVLPDTEDINGIIANYEKLQEALSVLQNTFSDTELKESQFYKAIYDRANELKPSIDAYNAAVDSLNANLSEQYAITALKDTILPETEEAFNTFRDELIESAKSQGDFAGTEADITRAINSYLATVAEFEQYYTDISETIVNNTKGIKSVAQAYSDIADMLEIKDYSSIKQDLIGLSQAGKLDTETLRGYENFSTILEALGKDASITDEELEEMIKTIDSMAQKNPVDYLNNYHEQLSKLEDAYTSFKQGERITSDQLSSLQDSFGNLDSYKEFQEKVLSGNTDLQSSFDAMATELAGNVLNSITDVMDVTNGLTEETKGYYEAELKAMGIANAHEVVEDALAGKQEYRRNILNDLNRANNSLNDTNKNLIISEDQLKDATADEVIALVLEAKQAGINTQYLAQYALQKMAANGITLSTSEDVSQLMTLAKAAGVSGEAMEYIVELEKIYQSLASGEQMSEHMLSKNMDRAKELQEKLSNLFKSEEYEVDFRYDGGDDVKDKLSSAAKEAETDWKDLLDKEIALLEAQLNAGLIDFNTYIDKRRDLIEQYYADAKISAEDYYDELKQMYENQLSYYDRVISAVTRLIDKRIKELEKQKEAIEESYQLEIDKLQSEIDFLEKENKARKTQIELEKAQYELQKALYNRNKRVKCMPLLQ